MISTARLLLVIAMTVALQAEPRIQLKLDANVGYAPLSINARILVEPSYLNTGVCLDWFSQELEGRACWSVEGQYAARTQLYTIKSLPAGDYHVYATVLRVRDYEVTPAQAVRILDRLN